MAGKHAGDPAPGEHVLDLQDRRVKLAEQREARFQRAAAARESRGAKPTPTRHEQRHQAATQRRTRRAERQTVRQESRPYRAAVVGGAVAGRAAAAPGAVAGKVTSGAGRAEAAGLSSALLVGFFLVAVRIVADFETDTTTATGEESATTGKSDTATRGKVWHPPGQYGPLPILTGLILSFFFFSLIAKRGGAIGKYAVLLAWSEVLVLGINSRKEIQTVTVTLGRIGSITSGPATGTESSNAHANDNASGNASTSPGTPSSPSSPGAKPKVTTPTTNSIGAGNRAAADLVKNFLPDVAGSFDILHPGRVIAATSQQWNDLTNAISDYATAGTNATWLGLQEAASAVGLKTNSGIVGDIKAIGNKVYDFFKGIF